MKIEEAMNILIQVCAQYRATRQEHQIVQTALQTIQQTISKPEVKKDGTDTKKVN